MTTHHALCTRRVLVGQVDLASIGKHAPPVSVRSIARLNIAATSASRYNINMLSHYVHAAPLGQSDHKQGPALNTPEAAVVVARTADVNLVAARHHV